MPFLVEGVRQHMDIETIHVITPDPSAVPYSWPGVVFDADADVLPYDRNDLRHRPSWCYQMIAKVFQDVTEHDWFVVMDGDIIPNNRIELWTEEGKPIFSLGRERRAMPAYFSFNKQMLGFGQVYEYSFLTECVLYSKHLVRGMRRFGGFETMDEWWRKCAEVTDKKCHIADAELYGSYVHREHPGLYEYRHIQSTLGGRYGDAEWTTEEIETQLEHVRRANPDAHLISIHTWDSV